MIHHNVNRRYIRLWQKNIDAVSILKEKRFFPFQYATFFENIAPFHEYILFVGINPSLTDDRKENYKWDDNFTKEKIEEIIQIDIKEEREYSYFKKMWQMADDMGLGLKHVDMFPIRHKSQSEVFEKLDLDFNKYETDFKESNDVRDECLHIFYDLLRQLQPKAIVLANALASRIFGITHSPYSFKTKFSSQFGYHTLHHYDLAIPIFFSGMFSGQRALDRFSFKD